MQRICEVCGSEYESKRKDSLTCSSTCRSQKRNGAKRADGESLDDSGGRNSLVKAIRAELDAAGKADTALGQLALSLAASMSGSVTGIAALSKELRSVMDAAIGVKPGAGAGAPAADAVDELRARRNAKRAG